MAKGNNQKQSSDSGLNFEAQLWAAADKMRGHMDASEYKHVCLGLIFLKYISDAFEEKREQLLFGFSDPKSEWFVKDEPERKEAAENRDEYLAANVFWLPPEARWHTIKAKAKSPQIGKVIDDAMGAIERENPTLKGVLPRDYARPSLDKVRLGGLVDIISNIGFNESAAKSKDVLGRVYEYFLGKFASAAASSTPRNASCRCSLPCLNPTKAACSIRAAVRAACSCSRRNSWKNTVGEWVTSRFTGRNPTTPPGNWRG